MSHQNFELPIKVLESSMLQLQQRMINYEHKLDVILKNQNMKNKKTNNQTYQK